MCLKDSCLDEAETLSNFCLTKNHEGTFSTYVTENMHILSMPNANGHDLYNIL